ncbi:MAG: glucose-1-phosphate adenylyltransferase [Deltaproteobacteria bacterium]|nr:glucose-1-phosphate adenylyltransferase [Deltaproteobacteria bacterium]
MVLAGGEGRRLWPLTRDRAKPAVPFGGRYRIIDFVLSNFINSGFRRIKVLTQYKSNSLNAHLNRGWRLALMLDEFVEAVPAQQRLGPDWYKGSADAVFQSLDIITDEQPDHVFVFGADHIYRMDVRLMFDAHVERDADLTVATIPVPVSEAHEFGIVEVDASWRIVGFEEKPKSPKPMPGDPTRALVSMGNYVFKTTSLIRELTRDAGTESSHDFGKNILTTMINRAPCYAYDFAQNSVPGMVESERGYWKDIGTLDAYFNASMDLIAVTPSFNLYNRDWPIRTANYPNPPAKFVFADRAGNRVGMASDSLVSNGCIVSGGRIERSILSANVRVNSFAAIQDSVLFEGVTVGRHARVRQGIVDKHVLIEPGAEVGFDAAQDRARGFTVTDSGITVVPKHTVVSK